MFGFVQWDSTLALLLEVVLSLLIVAALLVVVRRVNAQAESARQRNKPALPENPESDTQNKDDQYTQ